MPGSRETVTNAPADDPLAADKRTMIVALVAMIVLVSVGIVSAAVFTGSACQDVSPSPVSPVGASDEVDRALAIAFPDAEDDASTAIEAQLEAVGEQLGAVTGVAVVDGADGLAATSEGVAATGPVTSLLPASGSDVTAAVDVGDGVVVGSGDVLVSLARVNDLTGQVDAFATIDATAAGELTEIGCVDTATVGTPLAFELDAADGQLLLFRAEEDGADAELELRDPRDGRLWFARVDVGAAPPGVTGERIEGRLGDDAAVLVRRTAPDDDAPVVTVVDRADGSLRWQLEREALQVVPVAASGEAEPSEGEPGAPVLRDEAAQRLEVLALDGEQVVLALTDVRDEDAVVTGGTDALGPSVGPGVLVGLDVRDGTPRWQLPLPAGVRVSAASSTGTGVWLALDDGEQARLVGLDATGGPLDGSPDGVVAVVDDRLVLTGGDGDGDEVVGEGAGPLRARDLLATGDRVHVLFAGPVDGAGPDAAGRDLLVTFATGG